ncbi:MAG: hypothetical protein GX326_00825 [Clostridiaceae bacterium]|nr:hypothetical protein [Clostridiaceae bacterium]
MPAFANNQCQHLPIALLVQIAASKCQQFNNLLPANTNNFVIFCQQTPAS